MGQKINPNILRKKKTLSSWSCHLNLYANYVKNDYLIRLAIQTILQKYLVLVNILIYHITSNYKIINIITLYPTLKMLNFNFLKKLNIELNDEISLQLSADFKYLLNFYSRKIINILYLKKLSAFFLIKYNFITDIFFNVNLLSHFIVSQIERKVKIRRILTILFNIDNLSYVNGFKIILSGRLDGVERAYSEKKIYGSLPVNTFKSNIDYLSTNILTSYGIVGMKLWIAKKY